MTAIVTVTPNPAIDHTIFVPNFSPGKVNRAEGERFDAGGKGLNVASFLKDFALEDISASGFLGNENKELFERYLEKGKFATNSSLSTARRGRTSRSSMRVKARLPISTSPDSTAPQGIAAT